MGSRENSPDLLAERLQAQTHILERIASECWNETAANKVRKFAHEVTQAQWPAPPTLWEDK
jgi:hypothetical protein